MANITIRTTHARSALTPTGGFLTGFTHSFSPAIGCMLGRSACGAFCYAQFLQAHKCYGLGAWGDYLIVKENAADALRADLDRAARRAPDHKYHIEKIRVFSASSTEPLVGPLVPIYRDCLRVAAQYPIAAWVVQTRSPLARIIAQELAALGARAGFSLTIETDEDLNFHLGIGGGPTIAARRKLLEEWRGAPFPIHVAVSPALPMSNTNEFAEWLAEHADAVTVDTAVAGDGTGAGARTEKTTMPELLAARGANWRDESQARELYQLLQRKIGARAGWSCAGFARLAHPAALERRPTCPPPAIS